MSWDILEKFNSEKKCRAWDAVHMQTMQGLHCDAPDLVCLDLCWPTHLQEKSKISHVREDMTWDYS